MKVTGGFKKSNLEEGSEPDSGKVKGETVKCLGKSFYKFAENKRRRKESNHQGQKSVCGFLLVWKRHVVFHSDNGASIDNVRLKE